MADEIDITIDTSKLDKWLAQLPTKVAKKYMKSALQSAGDVIRESMVELAPERTDEVTPDGNSLPPGILKEDLTTQVIISDKSGAKVKVGPTGIAAHVCRWQNNGWKLTSHDGKQLKDIPGKHFMEGSIDESGQAAVDALVNSLAEAFAADSDGEE